MKIKSTGIAGLDQMLGGGLPEKKIILICGGPGSVKTILSIQCMIEALKRGEKCFFLTLEEPLESIKMNASMFGWDLDVWIKKGLLRMNSLTLLPDGGTSGAREKELDPTQTLNAEVIRYIIADKPKLVVIDPLTSLVVHEPRSGKKRYMIGDLFESLRRLGCDVLVTSETSPQEGDFYMEQFLADGILLLEKEVRDYKLIKTLRIDKMRGQAYDENPHWYKIDQNGFNVFSDETLRE